MKIRWRDLLTAFILSCALWYSVSGSEKVESQITVRIEYKGAPAYLAVRSGLINQISVRLKASPGRLRSIVNRDYSCSVDLSGIVKGDNILPFSIEQLPFHSGVEVIEISPATLHITAENLEKKTVPLTVIPFNKQPRDYKVQTNITPDLIEISGPESLVKDIDGLHITIPIDENTQPGTTVTKRTIPLPEGISATPQDAQVTLDIQVKQKLVHVTRTILIPSLGNYATWATPEKVNITALVPESLAKDPGSLSKITASVVLESERIGTYSLPIQVLLPNDAELVKVEPSTITLIIEPKSSTVPPKK